MKTFHAWCNLSGKFSRLPSWHSRSSLIFHYSFHIIMYACIHIHTYLNIRIDPQPPNPPTPTHTHIHMYYTLDFIVCCFPDCMVLFCHFNCLSVCVWLSVSPSVHPNVCLSDCPSIHLTFCPSICLPVCLSFSLSVHPSVLQLLCLSVFTSVS